MTPRPRAAFMARLALAACLFACLRAGPAMAARTGFDPAPLMAQAGAMLEQGRFLEGVDAYAMVFTHAQAPADKAMALSRMAATYALFLDDKAQALAIYDRVVADYRDEAPPGAAFDRAMLLYEAGRLERSRRAFAAFLAAHPDSPRRFTAEYMVERITSELSSGRTAAPSAPAAPGGKEPVIRVALASGARVAVTLNTPGTIEAQGSNSRAAKGGRVFTAKGGRVFVDGRDLGRSALLVPGDGRFALGGTVYAGSLRLAASGSTVSAVNVLPLEQYLLGVVPKEMSPSWEEEALKAQAVAARSYAAYLADKSGDKPHDVAATTASQVYGGAEAGNERTRRAVQSTRGRMLAEAGRPVLAYFHAHSGGMVEDDANVWTADMPYYRVEDDAVSQAYKPLSWTFAATTEQVAQALKKHGFNVSRVNGVRPGEKSPSGRLKTVLIDTDTGPVQVKANAFRIWLGAGKLKSVLCDISSSGGRVVFSGRGYGHGVGMSQWGAQGMAKAGHDYREILRHYYPGAEIATMY